MNEFWCTGTVTLDGVRFRIVAKDAAEAKQKAASGQFEDYELGTGDKSWEVHPDTVEG